MAAIASGETGAQKHATELLMEATLVRMVLVPAFMRGVGTGELVGARTAGAPA